MPVQRTGILAKGISEGSESMRGLWYAHTGEGLNTEPEHGENDPRDDTEIAEPETERRPVKYREGDVKSGTDGPVEDDDESDDEVPECYCRKCLPPEKKKV